MSRQITEIFIHCSATRPDWMHGRPVADKLMEIDRWHRQRGWAGFGYHYLVDRDGTVAPGRPEERVGAHVKGHNANSIGICLVGGHGSDENDRFSDHFTTLQDGALRELLDDLATRYPNAKVRGHNEVAAKACPGFNVARWLGKAPVTANRNVQASGVLGGAAALLPGLGWVADMEWQQLAVIGGFALVALVVAGVVFREELRWMRAGEPEAE